MTTDSHIVVTSDKGGVYSHIAATDSKGQEYTYIVVTNDEGQEYSIVVTLGVWNSPVPSLQFYLGSKGRDGLQVAWHFLDTVEKAFRPDFRDKAMGPNCVLSWENGCEVIRYARLRSMGVL